MPTLAPKWTNPTGGWWWHVRAWRIQNAWRPVMQAMHDEWVQQSPSADRLVLIGPSAGWMLSREWLGRFKRVETWDIDPWAGRLFDWRHGRALRHAGVKVHHFVGDAWEHESEWLRRDQESLYWFDNVLGQLRFMQAPELVRQRIERVKTRLSHVAWGSVHDRYSGPLRGMDTAPPAWRSSCGIDLLAPRAQDWLQAWGAEGSWLDHLTENVFRPQTPVLNLAWPFKPDFGHWLEMGWQLP